MNTYLLIELINRNNDFDIMEIDSEGNEFYYRKGKLHRLNGPAIERQNGYKAYYVNNKRHRLDGPAIKWANDYKEYWINGQQFTEEEFLRQIFFLD